MYSTRGIEAIATVTELRSKTSTLIDQAAGLETGIMIQKNNEPVAVLVGYDKYMELYELEKRTKAKKK
jgi:prevent-host-death family protein